MIYKYSKDNVTLTGFDTEQSREEFGFKEGHKIHIQFDNF